MARAFKRLQMRQASHFFQADPLAMSASVQENMLQIDRFATLNPSYLIRD